jgi:membrane peptidoglycan carboxypeptidase
MGGDHEYGRGDASGGDSRSYGSGRRGYGAGPGNGSGNSEPGGDDSYGRSDRGSAPRGYGEPTYGARGYGASDDAGSGGAREYGQQGGERAYGTPRGYGQTPSAAYGARGSAGRNGPIPGELVYGDAAAGSGRMPNGPEQPTQFVGGEAAGAAPRRSRLEERRARKAGGDPEYTPGQERSDRYGPSAIDGRSTRNGAGRRAADRAAGRPAKKVGYHRYFDYPRTGKDGWRRWAPSIKQVCSFALGGFFLLIGMVAFEYATVQIPTAESIASTAQVNTFTYDDGTSVIATEGSTNRTNVDISQIPQAMQNAMIAAEDKTFKTNPGISYTGMLRSFANDVQGKPLQGGSTITQQYVKNAYLTQSQTFTRKIDEIFIALKIGKTWTKNQVMQNYLNSVFFGRNSYGIQAASRAWLGKDVGQINDPADAAFMAALVNQPTNFSKGWDSTEDQATQQFWQQKLKDRWTAVLQNMQSYGLINQADYTAATAKFPTPVPQSNNAQTAEQQQMTQAVKNWIQGYASQNPGSQIPSLDQIESGSGGYTIVTTFNKQYMALAKQAVTDRLLDKIKSSKDWYNQNLYPALAAVDPTTGELVAFYGGSKQYNWATQGQVQPGSTFKAFTLATAFQQNWSPDSFISGDSPWPAPGNATELLQAHGDLPVANDDGSHGNLTLTTAAADSVNTAFVRLANAVTYKDVLKTVNNLGINDSDSQGLKADARLTLGIAAVSPARMAAAYSAFANNGSQYPLIEVKEIKSSDGLDWKPNAKPTQVLDPNVAQTVTQTLQHVTHDKGATAYGATGDASLNNIAGKTGTATMELKALKKNYPDIYAKTQNGYFTTAAVSFNGYTSKLEADVVVSRWIDEKDPTTGKNVQVQAPVDNINGAGFSFGASVSLPIWDEFMRLMQGTHSKFAGDEQFPTPNLSGMTIKNSPSPSPSPSQSNTPTSRPTGSESPSPLPSFSPTPTPTPSATCNQIFGLGNCGPTGGPTPTSSPTTTFIRPTASSTRRKP